MFSCEYWEMFKNTYFEEHLQKTTFNYRITLNKISVAEFTIIKVGANWNAIFKFSWIYGHFSSNFFPNFQNQLRAAAQVHTLLKLG